MLNSFKRSSEVEAPQGADVSDQAEEDEGLGLEGRWREGGTQGASLRPRAFPKSRPATNW